MACSSIVLLYLTAGRNVESTEVEIIYHLEVTRPFDKGDRPLGRDIVKKSIPMKQLHCIQ